MANPLSAYAGSQSHTPGMADKLSLVRDYLWQEARKRRHWWMGTGRPNGLAIARDLGVSQSTISRVLRGVRETRPARERKTPVPEYQISSELEAALMSFFTFRTPSDLYDALWSAQGAAPPARRSSGPRRRHRRHRPK